MENFFCTADTPYFLPEVFEIMTVNKVSSFPDLTLYSHLIEPFTLAGVKNVGWLDVESSFPKGKFPKEIFIKLQALVASRSLFRPLVESLRESCACQLCGPLELLDSAGKILPNAELWIPGVETLYASHIIILHYISVHNYLPPAEFIAAIEAVDERIPFVADGIYRERLMLSDWGKLSGTEKMNFNAARNVEKMKP